MVPCPFPPTQLPMRSLSTSKGPAEKERSFWLKEMFGTGNYSNIDCRYNPICSSKTKIKKIYGNWTHFLASFHHGTFTEYGASYEKEFRKLCDSQSEVRQ